jgi:hypothetical protein
LLAGSIDQELESAQSLQGEDLTIAKRRNGYSHGITVFGQPATSVVD